MSHKNKLIFCTYYMPNYSCLSLRRLWGRLTV